MTKLDAINPEFLRPNTMMPLLALLPFLMGAIGLAFASGAAEEVPTPQNPIAVLCLLVMAASLVLAAVSWLFKWNWDTRFFGAILWCMASVALAGGVPWLCLLLYSSAPPWLRVSMAMAYSTLLTCWSYRFFDIYQTIFSDPALREQIYVEQPGCFRYLQQGDLRLLEKRLKFRIWPATSFVLASWAVLFMSMCFASTLTSFFGLPFPHLFAACVALPTDMVALGMAVRGWMVFYVYPARLYRETGKRVYVDTVTKPAKLIKPRAR